MPVSSDAFRRALREWASGVTIVIVEHLMRVVTKLSTRMVVLHQGEVIAEGNAEAVMRDPTVVGAYLGKDYA